MRERPSWLRTEALAAVAVIGVVAGLVVSSDLAMSSPGNPAAGISEVDPSVTPIVPDSPSVDPGSADTASIPTIPGLQPSQSITAAPTPAPSPTLPPVPRVTPGVTPRATPPPIVASGWKTVVSDSFSSGGLPSWWRSYNGPYGSGPHNCAVPSHAVVQGGYLHLLMSYETSGPCGAGWYTGGLALAGASSVDQRVTVHFRIVDQGVAGHFIIPMRWPDDGLVWPDAGEEDYCESDTAKLCATYLHYRGNQQVSHKYSLDLTQWHTIRSVRRNHVVAVYIDNLTTPVWTYKGTSTTLPDTLKHVVLQQECQSKCPAGTDGSEDIQIDWITVENPA